MIKLNKSSNQSNVSKLINMEILSINSLLESEKAFSKQILVFFKNFIGNINVTSIFSDTINQFVSDSSIYLTKINSNIALFTNLLEILDNIKSNVDTVEYSNTVSKITKYNKKYKEASEKILKSNLEIENFIHSMATLDISEYINIDSLDVNYKEPEEETKTNKTTQKKDSSLIENTLTISELKQTVTLPYTIKELKKILRSDPEKYASLSDVIQDKFTVPLKNYKLASYARFKEAYNLIVNREKGTKRQAFNLASELFFNYNLHPAIITACKNQTELDVYLSCLEFDELQDFHFFKIEYEGLPIVVKKQNKFSKLLKKNNSSVEGC